MNHQPNWNAIVADVVAGQQILDQKKADINTALRLLKSSVPGDELERIRVDATVKHGRVTWKVFTAHLYKFGGLKQEDKLIIHGFIDNQAFDSTPPAEHVQEIYDALGILYEVVHSKFNVHPKLSPYMMAASAARTAS